MGRCDSCQDVMSSHLGGVAVSGKVWERCWVQKMCYIAQEVLGPSEMFDCHLRNMRTVRKV